MTVFLTKTFPELTVDELYAILKLRAEVFVVEQNCVYCDPDGRDRDCLHVLGVDEAEESIAGDDRSIDTGELIAYLRIWQRDGEPGVAQIGRVIAARRGEGLGRAVMEAGIAAARERLGAREIFVEAQVYARGFYELLGFTVCTDEFDEDGIPHIGMKLTEGAR